MSSLSDDTASTIILKKIKIRIKSKPLTIAFCDFICLTDSLPWFCGQFVLSIFLLSQLGSQNYCQINFHIRHELHQPLPPALPLPPSPLLQLSSKPNELFDSAGWESIKLELDQVPVFSVANAEGQPIKYRIEKKWFQYNSKRKEKKKINISQF